MAILLLTAAVILIGAQLALAVFNKSVTGGPLTVTSSTLSAVGGVSATQVNCRSNKSPEISVEWSGTTSSYASSYTVERATSSGGPYAEVASVTNGKTSYTDKSGSLGYSTTYYYRVGVVYDSWSAASSAAAVKTLGKSC